MTAVPYIQKAGFLTKNAKNPVLWKNAAEDAILGKKGRRCEDGNETDDWGTPERPARRT